MKRLNKKRLWIATPTKSARNDDETATTRCPTNTFGHNKQGAFTLVELVITIAIVIILSVVSVPIYQGYTKKAKWAEGYALMGTILSAEKVYFSENGFFYKGKETSYDEILGIDARGNKYFTLFFVFGSNPKGKETYCMDAGATIPTDLKTKSNMQWLGLQYNITLGAKIFETNAASWDWNMY